MDLGPVKDVKDVKEEALETKATGGRRYFGRLEVGE